MKPDLIVCLPDMDRIPAEHQDEARMMNATLVDYSGKSKKKSGNRMGHERKADPEFLDPQFPLAATHQRLGPWLIDDEPEEYRDCGPHEQASFGGVYVFRFHYSPLPEAENPWVRIESPRQP